MIKDLAAGEVVEFSAAVEDLFTAGHVDQLVALLEEIRQRAAS